MPSLRSQTRKKSKGDVSAESPAKMGPKKKVLRAKRTQEKEVQIGANVATSPSDPLKARTPPAGMRSPAVLVKQHLPLPPTRTSGTPSPYQVISDCVDSTCYEILMLENRSYETYIMLAQRLDYYMELMDHGVRVDNDDEELVLKDSHTRKRLFMARFVINLCSRPAYPSEDNQLPALSSLANKEWEELLRELESLREFMMEVVQDKMMPGDASGRLNVIKNLYATIKQRMEAMKALLRLQSDLKSISEELNKDDADEETLDDYPRACIQAYIKDSLALHKELKTASKTAYDDFFISKEILSRIVLENVVDARKSINSFLNKLGKMMKKEAIPLQQLQIDFSRLARECNGLLPLPKMVEVGYIGEANESDDEYNASSVATEKEDDRKPAAQPSTPANATYRPVSTPAKSIYDSSDDDDEAALKIRTSPSPAHAIERNKRKRAQLATIKENVPLSPSSDSRSPNKAKDTSAVQSRSPKKVKHASLDRKSEKHIDADMEANPSASASKRGKKRIKYTDEEKRCLLEGVKRFGEGNWAEIREHYDDVYKVNGRTNINLKDLYRTLTKGMKKEK